MALNPQIIFIKDPAFRNKVVNPTFSIHIDTYQRQDLICYCTRLYYDQNIPVDYSKQIKIALNEYLKNHIKEEDLKKIESIKKEEIRIIEADKKSKINLPGGKDYLENQRLK